MDSLFKSPILPLPSHWCSHTPKWACYIQWRVQIGRLIRKSGFKSPCTSVMGVLRPVLTMLLTQVKGQQWGGEAAGSPPVSSLTHYVPSQLSFAQHLPVPLPLPFFPLQLTYLLQQVARECTMHAGKLLPSHQRHGSMVCCQKTLQDAFPAVVGSRIYILLLASPYRIELF